MFLLLVPIVLLPGFQLVLFLQGRTELAGTDLFNYGASIFGFHWLMTNVLLSAKIPWFQKSIPYDTRIRVHIFTTIGIVLVIFYHALYKIFLGKDINIISWMLLLLLIILVASALLWIPLPGFKKLRSAFVAVTEKIIKHSYDKSKQNHGLFVWLFLILIPLHLLNADILNQVPPLSASLYVLLWFISVLSYFLSRIGVFNIAGIVQEIEIHHDILTLTVMTKDKINYKAGQFGFVRLKGAKGKKEVHPFSFLSVPGDELIRFGIRMRGDFTKNLSLLNPGEKIWINGGYGNFHPKEEKAICFISSGIGMVPILSLLKYLKLKKDQREIYVFISVNFEGEIPQLNILTDLQSFLPQVHLKVLFLAKKEQRYSANFFQQELPNPKGLSYYLCSSPKVRKEILKALYALGVKKSSIHFEDFSLG